jgi:hypothetical protein
MVTAGTKMTLYTASVIYQMFLYRHEKICRMFHWMQLKAPVLNLTDLVQWCGRNYILNNA